MVTGGGADLAPTIVAAARGSSQLSPSLQAMLTGSLQRALSCEGPHLQQPASTASDHATTPAGDPSGQGRKGRRADASGGHAPADVSGRATPEMARADSASEHIALPAPPPPPTGSTAAASATAAPAGLPHTPAGRVQSEHLRRNDSASDHVGGGPLPLLGAPDTSQQRRAGHGRPQQQQHPAGPGPASRAAGAAPRLSADPRPPGCGGPVRSTSPQLMQLSPSGGGGGSPRAAHPPLRPPLLAASPTALQACDCADAVARPRLVPPSPRPRDVAGAAHGACASAARQLLAVKPIRIVASPVGPDGKASPDQVHPPVPWEPQGAQARRPRAGPALPPPTDAADALADAEPSGRPRRPAAPSPFQDAARASRSPPPSPRVPPAQPPAGSAGGELARGASGAAQSLDGDSSSDEDGSDEWWCGALTGLVVERLMRSPVHTVHAGANISEARDLMARHDISSLLVDTGVGCEPGFVTRRDFLKMSFGRRSSRRRTRVSDIMSRPVISVPLGTPIEACARMLQQRGIRRALVRDDAAACKDPSNPLAAYVGVVCDASIFRSMGLFPPQTPAHPEDEGDDAAAVAAGGPSLAAMASFGGPGSEGPDTPSGLSRANTPRRGAPAPAAAAKPLTLPDLVAARERDAYASSGSSASGSSLLEAHHSAASSGPWSGDGGPDALSRYRVAASLWELDVGEIEVMRKIGEGSFGEVLLGNLRGTKVAVKRLRALEDSPSGGSSQGVVFKAFFEREIAILASIRHPNVVNFIGACHSPSNCALVTEYCARGSLDALLHKSGLPLDVAKRVEFALDVARGMSCLHAQRPIIIHRDLKTANLLVSARFEVKVADFGLSRMKDAAALQNSRAGLEGTIEYCAPEVLRGEPYTEKCDVYSFGVVLWELLRRRRPYADSEVPSFLIMMRVGSGALRLPPLDPSHGEATPGLAALVEGCLAHDPGARPPFRDILAVLEREYRAVRARSAASATSSAVDRSDSGMSSDPPGCRSPAGGGGAERGGGGNAGGGGSGPGSAGGNSSDGSGGSGAAAALYARRRGAAGPPPGLHLPPHLAPMHDLGGGGGAGSSVASSPREVSWVPSLQAQHSGLGAHGVDAPTLAPTPTHAAAAAAARPRPRRMSRARSLPMPEFAAWVEDEDGGQEEEGLQLDRSFPLEASASPSPALSTRSGTGGERAAAAAPRVEAALALLGAAPPLSPALSSSPNGGGGGGAARLMALACAGAAAAAATRPASAAGGDSLWEGASPRAGRLLTTPSVGSPFSSPAAQGAGPGASTGGGGGAGPGCGPAAGVWHSRSSSRELLQLDSPFRSGSLAGAGSSGDGAAASPAPPAAVLLHRHESLGRTGSGGCTPRSGALHGRPPSDGDHSHWPPHRHPTPTSRLSIQGSVELPPDTALSAGAAGVAAGAGGAQLLRGSSSASRLRQTSSTAAGGGRRIDAAAAPSPPRERPALSPFVTAAAAASSLASPFASAAASPRARFASPSRPAASPFALLQGFDGQPPVGADEKEQHALGH